MTSEMMGASSFADIGLFAGMLGIGGGIAGFVAGLLGVGGGIVLVLVLYHILVALDVDAAVRMHVAVGTSLATIIPTSLASMRAHRRRDAIDTDLLQAWGAWITLGVLVGVLLVSALRGQALMIAFAILCAGVAVNMALPRESARSTSRLPTGAPQAAIAITIGTISTLVGIGGGTLVVPTLSWCGYPIRRAVGTASAIGFIIAVPATLGFVVSGWHKPGLPLLSLGYVNVLGITLIVPLSILTAAYGARVAHSIDGRWLRVAFAVFMSVTAARMLYAAYQ